MKRQFRQVISCVLTLTLLLTMAVVPVFAEKAQTTEDDTTVEAVESLEEVPITEKALEKPPITEEALKAEINELYASEPGLVGRTHKMQAFIMELALHAKMLNPDFKIIPQDAAELAFIDGDVDNGVLDSLISLVDGWGKEEMLFDGDGNTPNDEQRAYVELVKEGLMVTETSTVETAEDLEEYYARAEHWGIIPYPRIGGELAQELFPAKRWAENGDYFWVEDPEKIGLGDRIDGARDVDKLTDAENYLYNINSRPYDAWDTWDDEEAAAVAEGEDGDRTRIYDSYGNGLLVPSADGKYQPVAGEDGDPADVDRVLSLYGDKWDWWWREAGLDENAGRDTWLNALRNSDYDVIYIDSFYNHRALPNNQTPLTKEEVDSLKVKPDGGRRQVIAYLSVGSAEQNRWYCQDDWVWVDPSNPNTERSMKSGKITGTSPNFVYSPPENAPTWLALGYGGNYAEEAVVQWWHPEWRDIIINGGGKYKNVATGDNTSSIDRIISQGFDGVYLDNVGVYNRQSKKSGGWNEFENYWLAHGGIPGETSSAPLVSQDLDYTENPVDVPNPDRGFERGNDDAAGLGASDGKYGYMTVPASADTILGQPFEMAYEMNPPLYFGGPTKGPEYCNVPVEPNIVQFYLVLNNFSSNAWCDSTPGNPSDHTRQGIDGPITQYGLDFIRNQLQFIRDHTNSVAHIRVCYDPKGWNQFVWTADNLKYEDSGRGDNYYYRADYSKPVAPEDLAAHIAKPGAGTWRGSSPIFRKCTVPGFEDMNWVQYHYYQLKPIFQEYSDIIWAFDSGTFGPWGESHSNYEAEVSGNYKMILDSLLDAVPDGKPIMTHIGGFLDWYNRTYNTTYDFGTLNSMPAPVRGTPEARFGMFDDSNGWSQDEYSYGDNGSLTEGYRMLAHDPMLPGYNPTGIDPSMTRDESTAPGSKVSSVIGYNDFGTNSLAAVPETLDDPRWRGVWFKDWDRTKLENFLGKMSVYGGEQIGSEPKSGTNGGFVPVGERVESPLNDVILRFPSMFYEHSIAGLTYMCMQQGSGSFKSRADYPYTEDSIGVEITYPWNDQKVQVLYDPVYEGQSALAYYRDRLGYRLVLREAEASEWVAQNGTLKFEGKIQNVGWGEVFNKKAVKVILKSKSNKFVSNAVLTNIDPYDWQPAEVGPDGEMPDSRANNTKAYRDLNFSINMGAFGELPVGDYDIYLKINDPKETTANKRSIRFANKGDDIWDADLGANLIGSTTVNPAELSNDDADIAFAKAAIENAAYSATQASVPTEAKALAKINEIISALNLRGVRTNVSKVSYTAAVAGTSGNRSGTNGSYDFTVELNKGLGTAVVTQELTLAITATSYRSGGSHGGGTTTTPPAIVTPVVTPSAIGFPDSMPESARAEIMKETPWAAESIAELISIGAIDGTAESFRPRDNITRAEFIKIMVYVLGLEPDYSTASGFGDVNAGSWYLPYVNAAVKAGIINGRDDGTFGANVPISRQDIAAIIYRAAQGIMPAGNAGSFKDADKISPYALEGVGALAEAGIVNGMGGGSFAPKNSATRAEAAKMLAGFLKYLKEASD